MLHFAGLVNITPKTLGLMVDISIGINQLITGGCTTLQERAVTSNCVLMGRFAAFSTPGSIFRQGGCRVISSQEDEVLRNGGTVLPIGPRDHRRFWCWKGGQNMYKKSPKSSKYRQTDTLHGAHGPRVFCSHGFLVCSSPQKDRKS